MYSVKQSFLVFDLALKCLKMIKDGIFRAGVGKILGVYFLNVHVPHVMN